MNDKRRTLIRTLKEKNLTLAIAESVTCGLAAHKLSTLPGVSDILTGSVVCYAPEVKTGLLGVPEKLVEKYTCESAQVTKAITLGLSKIIDADLHAGITGLASPGGSESKKKPVGTIFLTVYFKEKIYNKRFLFRGTPAKIRTKACSSLYSTLLSLLK